MFNICVKWKKSHDYKFSLKPISYYTLRITRTKQMSYLLFFIQLVYFVIYVIQFVIHCILENSKTQIKGK